MLGFVGVEEVLGVEPPELPEEELDEVELEPEELLLVVELEEVVVFEAVLTFGSAIGVNGLRALP